MNTVCRFICKTAFVGLFPWSNLISSEVVAVYNQSFEEGRGMPAGWSINQGNQTRPSIGTIFSWDKEFSRTGQRSIYLRKEAIGPTFWRSQSPATVKPGERYTLRVWYRIPKGYNSSLRAGVSSVRQPGEKEPWSNSVEIKPTFKADQEWQEFRLDFETPPTVDKIFVSLANSGSGRKQGEINDVWFDDVEILKINTP